jgi:hypothetical protein
LLTTFTYTFVDGVASLLNPKTPGVINCVAAPPVITSAMTPDPGRASVFSVLPASAVLLAVSV